MLQQPMINKMLAMRLHGMAQAIQCPSCRKLQKRKTNWLRKKQCSNEAPKLTERPKHQGVGEASDVPHNSNSPTNSPDGAKSEAVYWSGRDGQAICA